MLRKLLRDRLQLHQLLPALPTPTPTPIPSASASASASEIRGCPSSPHLDPEMGNVRALLRQLRKEEAHRIATLTHHSPPTAPFRSQGWPPSFWHQPPPHLFVQPLVDLLRLLPLRPRNESRCHPLIETRGVIRRGEGGGRGEGRSLMRREGNDSMCQARRGGSTDRNLWREERGSSDDQIRLPSGRSPLKSVMTRAHVKTVPLQITSFRIRICECLKGRSDIESSDQKHHFSDRHHV